ncbi:GIY-YIG nuclease family protein [Silanimonas algicola]
MEPRHRIALLERLRAGFQRTFPRFLAEDHPDERGGLMSLSLRSDPSVVWWLYLVLCENGRIYTGISPNPELRYAVHRQRRSAHMKINKPVSLIASVPVGPYSAACKLERQVKRLSPEAKKHLASTLPNHQAGVGQR